MLIQMMGIYGRNIKTVTRSGLRFKSVAHGWSPGNQLISHCSPVSLKLVVSLDLEIFFQQGCSKKRKTKNKKKHPANVSTFLLGLFFEMKSQELGRFHRGQRVDIDSGLGGACLLYDISSLPKET